MKKRLLLIITACSLSISATAVNLDSLWNIWNDNTQADTTRLKAMNNIAWDGYLFSQPDSAFYFAQMQYDLAKKSGLKKQMARALNTQGSSFYLRGNYPKALDYYQKSLKIYEEIDHKGGISAAIGSIGNVYQDQGDYPKALDYYQRSLKINEEIDNKEGSAAALGNIGIIYRNQEDYPKALDHYQKSLKINEEMGNKRGIANALNNIGFIYDYQGDSRKAMDHYQRSLKIYEEMGDKYGIANALAKIGILYQKEGKHKKAIKQCSKGLLLAQEIEAIALQREACQCLYDAHKSTGNGNKALAYHEQMLALDDSLNAEESVKALQQMEFSKQVFADSLANAEKAKTLSIKNANTRNILIGAALLFLLVAGGLFSRWRFTKKAKNIIEIEKDRSNSLLLNILPADIAEELKIHGKAEARDFDMVSILFTDFKGFTEASAKLSASDLVSEINTCFEAFDGIMAKYGIEKIKTIGDAYMAAGGLPVPTEDSTKNTILAALEMQDFIGKRKTELDAQNKPAFEMRVGIHTGPVVAGIVGVKKFQYDIWGDTVNTAARMESSSEVGKVNISHATYELIKGEDTFTFEHRGKIEAKGKGEIDMWFVQLKKH